MIRLQVLGYAIGEGNKRPIRNQHTGRIALVEGRTGEAATRFKSWREAVRSEAQDAAEQLLPDGPFEGPCAVRLTFGLPKPKSAPKTRRTWPIGKRSGDIDKLARAVLDSLTGVVFGDDAQVVDLRVTKDFDTPGCLVEVFGPDELADVEQVPA